MNHLHTLSMAQTYTISGYGHLLFMVISVFTHKLPHSRSPSLSLSYTHTHTLKSINKRQKKRADLGQQTCLHAVECSTLSSEPLQGENTA